MKPIRLGLTIFSTLALFSYSAQADVKVKTENLDEMGGAKKIVLANFVVEFQNQYETQASGFGLFGGGTSSTTYNNAPLPSGSVLQAITNQAREHLITKLKAKGYQVIEPSAISAQASYENFIKSLPAVSGDKFDNQDGESVLYTPTGYQMTVPLAGGGPHYLAITKGHLLGGFSNASKAMSSGWRWKYEEELTKAEGAPLLKVWITVGFGDADARGGAAAVESRQRSFSAMGESVTTTYNDSAGGKAHAGMFLKPLSTHFAITSTKLSPSNLPTGSLFGQKSPLDGDIRILLESKYIDDGSPVLSLENSANTISVKDTVYKDSSYGTRTTTEKGQQGGAATASNGTRLTKVGSTTSGRLDTVSGSGTALHTHNEYVTEIKSDIYATSSVKMIDDVLSAFIDKL